MIWHLIIIMHRQRVSTTLASKESRRRSVTDSDVLYVVARGLFPGFGQSLASQCTYYSIAQPNGIFIITRITDNFEGLFVVRLPACPWPRRVVPVPFCRCARRIASKNTVLLPGTSYETRTIRIPIHLSRRVFSGNHPS